MNRSIRIGWIIGALDGFLMEKAQNVNKLTICEFNQFFEPVDIIIRGLDVGPAVY
jgi:hypothetical protein